MNEPATEADTSAVHSRTRQGRERIQSAIREAAIEEFSRHGFKGASTKAIAERAGLTKPQLLDLGLAALLLILILQRVTVRRALRPLGKRAHPNCMTGQSLLWQ